MKRCLSFFLVICLSVVMHAKGLVPTTWTAYGLTFNAPEGILIEEDTEDTYLLNNTDFYITVQSMDSDELALDGLQELLEGLAADDSLENVSAVRHLDLPQFHGVYLQGTAEGDACYYACLMTKDAGSVFYVSVIYENGEADIVEKILESFKMEEE